VVHFHIIHGSWGSLVHTATRLLGSKPGRAKIYFFLQIV
jgi:hypothetical protein